MILCCSSCSSWLRTFCGFMVDIMDADQPEAKRSAWPPLHDGFLVVIAARPAQLSARAGASWSLQLQALL